MKPSGAQSQFRERRRERRTLRIPNSRGLGDHGCPWSAIQDEPVEYPIGSSEIKISSASHAAYSQDEERERVQPSSSPLNRTPATLKDRRPYH